MIPHYPLANMDTRLSINPDILSLIRENQRVKEKNYQGDAFRSSDATRYNNGEKDNDPRPIFFRDTDRIIHSQAYARYIDKTQVFYLLENDHVTHRVLHVQLVSKIARTIGRFLRLNEDLIEAISLGHDVGHTPFGHNGETIISKFCQKNNIGVFEHNVQSFRLFHELENNGKGLNLSVQVLDGIICHNGELLQEHYSRNSNKTKEQLLDEYKKSIKIKGISSKMIPMTLEGCVMRISDIIAYIGRDIEDAILVNLIQRKDIPKNCSDVLGERNRDIVNNLIVDVVNNSYGKDYLCFSEPVYSALNNLKSWACTNIYQNPKKSTQDSIIENMFNTVLNECMEDLEHRTDKTHIQSEFLSQMEIDSPYRQTENARIVADYVSGMTDEYLQKTYKHLVVPHSFGHTFDD